MRVTFDRRRVGLLAFVAISASVLAIVWRTTDFRERAQYHHNMAAIGIKISFSGQPLSVLSPTQIAYHQGLETKYRKAAAQPWWPLGPDPREP